MGADVRTNREASYPAHLWEQVTRFGTKQWPDPNWLFAGLQIIGILQSPFVPSKGGEQPSSPPADCFETPSFVLSLNTQAKIPRVGVYVGLVAGPVLRLGANITRAEMAGGALKPL